jgi:hypothetical protein
MEPTGSAKLMYSWAVKGDPRHHTGVTTAEGAALAEVSRVLHTTAAGAGCVRICRLDPLNNRRYVYGQVVARAELDRSSGSVIWTRQ